MPRSRLSQVKAELEACERAWDRPTGAARRTYDKLVAALAKRRPSELVRALTRIGDVVEEAEAPLHEVYPDHDDLVGVLRKGPSNEIRAMAVEAFAVLEPAAFEPLALALLAQRADIPLAEAAVVHLRGARSDAVLDALIAALAHPFPRTTPTPRFVENPVRLAAVASLSAMRHPAVVERVLAWLTPARIGEAAAHVDAALTILAAKKARLPEPVALIVADKRDEPHLRAAIAPLLAKGTSAAARTALDRAIDSDDMDGIAAMAKVFSDPKTAYDRLAPHLRRVAVKRNTLRHLASDAEVAGRKAIVLQDRRWLDVAFSSIGAPSPIYMFAATILARARDPRAATAIAKRLADPKSSARALSELLVRLGDPSIIPLLEVAAKSHPPRGYSGQDIPKAIAKLRKAPSARRSRRPPT